MQTALRKAEVRWYGRRAFVLGTTTEAAGQL
jgi:hypothetical protein